MTQALAGCPLCEADGGVLLVRQPKWRLIRAEEPGFPAFYRVVWNQHVREFSDLSAADRAECLRVVVEVEQALRSHLQPAKINLATLGNAVPHLHWHVVARFAWDSHFPGAPWAQAQRETPVHEIAAIEAKRAILEQDLMGRLAGPEQNRSGS